MSAPMFKVDVAPGILERLVTMMTNPKMVAELKSVMNLQNEYTVTHIMDRYLSFLPSDPPTLDGLRSITSRLRGAMNVVPAEVTPGGGVAGGVSNNVKYMRIHELGGQIPPHDIVARNAKALRFKGAGGNYYFAKLIHHPGSNMPARAPMQRGIIDRLEAYKAAFEEAIPRILNQ